MKNLLFTFIAFVMGIVGVSAQSLNINHAGVQTTYSADEIDNIDFNSGGAFIKVNSPERAAGTSIATSSITSIESSAAPADYFTKYADGEPAQVVFSVPVVNNINPLQALNFKLEKTNKYQFVLSQF